MFKKDEKDFLIRNFTAMSQRTTANKLDATILALLQTNPEAIFSNPELAGYIQGFLSSFRNSLEVKQGIYMREATLHPDKAKEMGQYLKGITKWMSVVDRITRRIQRERI